MFLFKEGLSQGKGQCEAEAHGTFAVWVYQELEWRPLTGGGSSGFMKPKYSVPFQDLGLGRNKSPSQNLGGRIYFNIFGSVLLSSFSRFNLAN